jgi:DNA topoisomerase-3
VGKALVITEKPSVARDIVAALGGFHEHEGFWESDRFVVTFSVGHLLELLAPEDIDPTYKRWTLDTLPILPEKFEVKPKEGATERVRTIKKLLERSDVDDVVNACDAGREGELIFREIVKFLGTTKPVRRLWLQSMTADAIRDGFAHLRPGADFERLGFAAECRSQSDWLIGMNATRALTRRLQSKKEKTAWSAGRVQTPTLAILVDREFEVLAHEPRPFWRVQARFDAARQEYAATWFDPAFKDTEPAETDGEPREGRETREARDDRIFDEARARQIADAVRGQTGQASETRKPSREQAPPLFDLTSLQREGNRRFGWSARRTLNAAQRCYEAHKLLTYPRTDSRCLPNDYREIVDGVIETFAAESPWQRAAARLREQGLQNTKRTFDDSKVSDHFAIIPTGKLPEVPLSGDDAKLFDLVARRFLASFHPPAVWTRVERITEVSGNSFRSRSRTLDEPGWREVMGQTEQEDQVLPPLVEGRDEASGVAARTLEVETTADETRPPARHSEARLLTLMENAGQWVEDEMAADAMHEKGIGTPATRADIIENLISKDYVIRVGKALRPSVKGIRLVDSLRRIQADRLASPALTGELEHQLREVERGQRTPAQFMKEMVEYTTQIVDRTRGFEYDELYANDPPVGTCPCEKRRPVIEQAWFYRCEQDPELDPDQDCTFRLWKDKSGRYMDRGTVATLLEKGETRALDGFLSRDGRVYQGVLKLEGKELRLHPVTGPSGERATGLVEYEVDPAPLGPCPLGCGRQVVESSTHFICQGALEAGERQAAPAAADKGAEKPCSFVLPRTVCRREVTREEALAYVRDKKTPLLSDFISRFNRPFAATLVLKENGRHGFEFQPREGGARPGGGARGGRKAGGARKGSGGRKKAAAKKAGTRKAAAAEKPAAASAGAAAPRKKVIRRKAAGAPSES